MNQRRASDIAGAEPSETSLAQSAPQELEGQWRESLCGFGVYLLLSVGFIGRAVIGAMSGTCIGQSNDPSVYMWSLGWWPHAIAHGLNPFVTSAVWAPEGFNLAWTTTIPLAALISTPVTRVLGIVATYNLLCMLALALAAWASFLLCRRIGANFWASLIGGYLFGFSAYMLAEARAHLPLLCVFPIPLVVLFTIDWFADRLSPVGVAIRVGLALIAAFMLWPELYSTMTVFGVIALAVAFWLGDEELRIKVRRFSGPIAGSYAITLVAVAPYLYYFLQPGYPRTSINSPTQYSSDLLNLILPTPVNALGTIRIAARMARRYQANMFEASAYVGLPLIAIAIWQSYRRWHDFETKLLVTFLAIVGVLTIGPRLHVGGVELFGMPWKLMLHLPLLHHALPARFTIYGFLALAILASRWLSAPRPASVKAIVVLLLAISLCPNLDAAFWRMTVRTPIFFTGDYRQELKPGENVIVLPYGYNGISMLWQAEAQFYFRMAGGWTSITPRAFQSWPIVGALLDNAYIPDAPSQLRAFMATHEVSAIVSDDSASSLWKPLLQAIDSSPTRAAGVAIYRVSDTDLAQYRNASALQMERRNDEARFAALLAAGSAYLGQGNDRIALTPMHAQALGMLPQHWTHDPDVRTNNGLYLGPWGRDEIGVGVVGSYEALQPLIAEYRQFATEIFFPFPKKLVEPPHGDTFMRLLVMTLDRDGLARAAAIAPAEKVGANAQ